jgi:hypothetical protein
MNKRDVNSHSATFSTMKWATRIWVNIILLFREITEGVSKPHRFQIPPPLEVGLWGADRAETLDFRVRDKNELEDAAAALTYRRRTSVIEGRKSTAAQLLCNAVASHFTLNADSFGRLPWIRPVYAQPAARLGGPVEEVPTEEMARCEIRATISPESDRSPPAKETEEMPLLVSSCRERRVTLRSTATVDFVVYKPESLRSPARYTWSTSSARSSPSGKAALLAASSGTAAPMAAPPVVSRTLEEELEEKLLGPVELSPGLEELLDYEDDE